MDNSLLTDVAYTSLALCVIFFGLTFFYLSKINVENRVRLIEAGATVSKAAVVSWFSGPIGHARQFPKSPLRKKLAASVAAMAFFGFVGFLLLPKQ